MLKAAFALPTGLLVQAYNKREWPMFLRARGRTQEAEAAARMLIANAESGHSGDRPHRARLRDARRVAVGRCRHGIEYRAANCCAPAPGGAIAANALLALQGEIQPAHRGSHQRHARRSKKSPGACAAAPGPDAWSQALFTLEAMARTARAGRRLGARRHASRDR